MADPRVSQDGIEIVTSDPGSVTISQDGVEVVVAGTVPARITQGGFDAVLHLQPPQVNASQVGFEIVGKGLFEDDFVTTCCIT
jgi:hypothetical protein